MSSNPQPSTAKKVIGWILAVLFTLTSFTTIVNFVNGKNKVNPATITALVICIALAKLGFRLIESSKGNKK